MVAPGRFPPLLLLVLSLLLVACGQQVGPAELASGSRQVAATTLEGRVVDQLTNKGIAKASVRMVYGQANATTGADGAFTLGPIPFSGGAVVVEAPGYQSRTLPLDPSVVRPVVGLLRQSASLPYAMVRALAPELVLPTGRVAIAGQNVIATGRVGSMGTVISFDGMTGQVTDRTSWVGPFQALPIGLADVASHGSLGTLMLSEQGKLYLFNAQDQFRLSASVASGTGALATDGRRIYVADSVAIHVLGPDLREITKWKSTLGAPSGVALDSLGNVYVASLDARIQVFDAEGRVLSDWRPDGLSRIGGIAASAVGDVFVTDPQNRRVFVLSPDGRVEGSFGNGVLDAPRGLAVDPEGAVYVVDINKRAILRFEQSPVH